MAKYMILYSSSTPASVLMSNATTEQMQASMQQWIKWREDAALVATVDFGMPMQAIAKITPEGLGDSGSIISGYATVEGNSKEAILELLKTHPHLSRPDATIDVFEILPMPGIK